jgi:hypothetical protein
MLQPPLQSAKSWLPAYVPLYESLPGILEWFQTWSGRRLGTCLTSLAPNQ